MCVCVGGGGVHWLGIVFGQGVKGGVAIYEAFPSCKMVIGRHFFDVEQCFVVSIYLGSIDDWVFACGQKMRPCVHVVSASIA